MSGEKIEGIDGVPSQVGTTSQATTLVAHTEATISSLLDAIPAVSGGTNLITSSIGTSGEFSGLIPRAGDSLDVSSELSDEQKLIEQLNILQGKLEPALAEYLGLYKREFKNISGMAQTIEHGMSEGLSPETIRLETIFSGLRREGMNEEAPLFGELLSKFMEKDSKTQAAMLSFFELINTYAIQKGYVIAMHKNPLKKMLFSEGTISYKNWIVGVFQKFDTDGDEMIALSKAILDSEAPKIIPTPRELIKQFFQEHVNELNDEDKEFLTRYYKDYPDDSLPVAKGDTVRKLDIARRNDITPKYIIKFTEHGVASDESMRIAQNLRDTCAQVIIQSSETPLQIGLSE